MAIRVPPGRAGRIWLLRRLEIARRGADVLDQKRRTLLRERQRLAERLAAAAADWELAARDAATWNARAQALSGQRRLRLAAFHARKATVTVTWRNMLGVVVPVDTRLEPGDTADFVALGGGAGVALAARAHADALAAAVVCAEARAAHEAIATELATTTLRLRAIERRWIPDHEAALKALELTLAENELADVARARWAGARQR